MEKLPELKRILQGMGSVLVTFSGGVDSAFLAKVAADALGAKATAMTAVSASLPAAEMEEANRLAALIGIRHLLIEAKELDDPRYAANPVNRCYFCKTELFSLARRVADEQGIAWVVDGTHADDLKEPRPGRQAAKEWGVRSPLLEAEFTKQDIRAASRRLGLPNWDKPAAACLASRIPAGTSVTVERLSRIEQCELALKRLGFRQLRARYEEDGVRLELEPGAMERLGDPALEAEILKLCRQAGFQRVFVDLAGYGR